MKETRKKLYIAVLINFFIGIIVGIVLFYAQLRSTGDAFGGDFTYDATVELGDLFRVAWLNLLWLFSILIAHNILPSSYIHPIIIIRGCSNAFSAMYMMHFIGIKEAALTVLPQCFSILLLLAWGSVTLVERRRKENLFPSDMLSLRRGETLMFFLLAMLCGAAEIFFFKVFQTLLF